ncbi:glutamate racemase [Cupriavidus pauculus]|uniref:Asp/Glu racemase n=1 Tax=Cupriavidus pauculus TaxID=82633 RepID=A0A2N5CB61_9BURK|nr:aspartate/glutamate racemase family protein [Cupriavidus pauculus]PLP99457.1 Asp/Glu racemase [Cupriavidus pauculus]
MQLHRPIGIFDAGIGSYAIVERVRARFPEQDILYFADRESFPYGAKTPDELLTSVQRATEYLQEQGCVAVILASNAPSIVVLTPLRAAVTVPVIGVFPPVREAINRSTTKEVAVFGVRSMTDSQAMRAFANEHREPHSIVHLVNASALVDLVETFAFINAPEDTQIVVTDFVARVRSNQPGIDVMTLSSTHLPWLKPFFEIAAPDILFIDPADTVIEEIATHTSQGKGRTVCVATESEELSLLAFNAALGALNAPIRASLKR